PNVDERRNGQSSLPRHPDNGHYEPSPTGLGKSWIACALGHKVCRDGRSAGYHRVPRLFEALAIARDDGRHARMLNALARVEVLILDDWGLTTARRYSRELSVITWSTVYHRAVPQARHARYQPDRRERIGGGNGDFREPPLRLTVVTTSDTFEKMLASSV
ncbi:ATP-binding protein, partial [Mesorhizobium sp. M0933]|uniref:ATP-binding protein n=1 Tax=Mesorhizobium sp. M0933 TaxID=2957030 RepID=UPI003337DB6F